MKNPALFLVRNKSSGGTNLIKRAYRAPASFSQPLMCPLLYPLPKFRFVQENFVRARFVVCCCCLRLRLIDTHTGMASTCGWLMLLWALCLEMTRKSWLLCTSTTLTCNVWGCARPYNSVGQAVILFLPCNVSSLILAYNARVMHLFHCLYVEGGVGVFYMLPFLLHSIRVCKVSS